MEVILVSESQSDAVESTVNEVESDESASDGNGNRSDARVRRMDSTITNYAYPDGISSEEGEDPFWTKVVLVS